MLSVVGCSQGSSEAVLTDNEVTPTNPPVPTGTPVPTRTPVPADTPVPTGTPVPTRTPVPTDTPVPTGTPSSNATPNPTRTPTKVRPNTEPVSPTLAPTLTPLPTAPKSTPTPAPSSERTPLPDKNTTELPHVFVGLVALNGIAAADGTEVTIWVAEYDDPIGRAMTAEGSYTVFANQYGLSSFSGRNLIFKVNGQETGETATWEKGGATILDLSLD